MKKSLIFLLVVLQLIVVNLWADNGKSAEALGQELLEVISPPNGVEVSASLITIKVKTTGIYRVTAINQSIPTGFYNNLREGVKNKDHYLIYNIPLQKGSNEINVSVRLKNNLPVDGAKNSAEHSNSIKNKILESKILTINSLVDRGRVATVEITPLEAYGEVDATIKVTSAIENIKAYHYDFDSDGKIDKISTKNSVTKNFTEGVYKPAIMLEDENGLLFSVSPFFIKPLKVMPIPKAVKIEGFDNIDILDIEVHDGLILLTKDKIYLLDDNDTIKQTIPLNGITNPQGFTTAGDVDYINGKYTTDIYVADTGNNRIVRFIGKNGYAMDPNYEIKHNFNQPVDVYAKGRYLEVLDRGNNRVVLFEDGNISSIFTGEGTLNGKLNNPISMESVYILDRDGLLMRDVDIKNKTEKEVSLNSENHGKFAKLLDDRVIGSETNRELLLLSYGFNLKNKIPLDCTPKFSFGGYLTCKDKKGLFYIDRTPEIKGNRPIDLAKEFIKAIYANDTFTMHRLSFYQDKIIKELGSMNLLKKVLDKTVKYNAGEFGVDVITNYKITHIPKYEGYKIKVFFSVGTMSGQFIRTGDRYIESVQMLPIKDER